MKANGRENLLPDLSMSVDQLFFIGFATVCFNTPAFFPPAPLPVLVTKGWTMRKVKGGGGGGCVGVVLPRVNFFGSLCEHVHFFLPVSDVCIFFFTYTIKFRK